MAALGSQSYGNPVVAGGKVFVALGKVTIDYSYARHSCRFADSSIGT